MRHTYGVARNTVTRILPFPLSSDRQLAVSMTFLEQSELK
jgi:hypothetical protein